MDAEYDMTMEDGDLSQYFTACVENAQILNPRRLCYCGIIQMLSLNCEGGNRTHLMLLLPRHSAKDPVTQEERLASSALHDSSGVARAYT